jgi:hypothetical protein
MSQAEFGAPPARGSLGTRRNVDPLPIGKFGVGSLILMFASDPGVALHF